VLLVAMGGTLLAEEQEVDIERTANAQQVDTVAKGFAGVSPGSPMLMMDVKNAMPQGGFEFDAGNAILGLLLVPVQVSGPGGKTVRGDAFILKDSIRHGVNAQATYSFSAIMPLQLFK
jgi:hypothetical protein